MATSSPTYPEVGQPADTRQTVKEPRAPGMGGARAAGKLGCH